MTWYGWGGCSPSNRRGCILNRHYSSLATFACSFSREVVTPRCALRSTCALRSQRAPLRPRGLSVLTHPTKGMLAHAAEASRLSETQVCALELQAVHGAPAAAIARLTPSGAELPAPLASGVGGSRRATFALLGSGAGFFGLPWVDAIEARGMEPREVYSTRSAWTTTRRPTAPWLSVKRLVVPSIYVRGVEAGHLKNRRRYRRRLWWPQTAQ